MAKLLALISLFTTVALNVSLAQSADHWESIIYGTDIWKYYVNTGTYPDAQWMTEGFDDSSWQSGPGGIGYADNDDGTLISLSPYPVSVHTRILFEISDTSMITSAVLNIDFDDGFIAWINGVEIARANMGSAGQDPSVSQPGIDHEAMMYQGLKPPSFVLDKAILNKCLRNGQNLLAVQVNNFGSASSDLSCISYLSVGLTTNEYIYRSLPSWFEIPYTGFEGSELPLIMIETHGVLIPVEDKALMDFGIINNGPGRLNKPGDEWNAFNGQAGIEYRGSSSMGFPKRNYGIETRTRLGLDSAVSLLGMPVEADWVLHGPYSDKSLVRNRLAYDLARNMGHYAPRGRFCEMFIDGQYQGVYVLLEKIKRDSNRVNIAELDSSDIEGHDLTGGYIIKIDRSADGSYMDGWYSSHLGSGTGLSGPFFAWHYPKWENILPVQQNYIKNRVTKFEDALFGSNYKDPYVGYRNYINVISFIDYFLLVELSKNVDGYRLSTFLYKDRDDRDPKIHMGPAWDYDLAFGNADYYEASTIQGWSYPIVADGWGTPYWWSRFLTDAYFANSLKCRWKDLREGVLSDEFVTSLIDAYVDTIGEAHVRNFVQWPIHGQYVWPNAFVGNTYQEDVTYMKNWIISRMEWMDQNMPGVCSVTGNDDYDMPDFFAIARPNPSFGKINLEILNRIGERLKLEVINISGQVMYTEDLPNDDFLNRTIPLPAGIYLVRTGNGIDYHTLKAIVR